MAIQYSSQCETPIEKKKVLRREKDVGRDPERMATRREEGRAFHREGPIVAKDLVWAIVILTRGTKRECLSKKERERRANVPNLDL